MATLVSPGMSVRVAGCCGSEPTPLGAPFINESANKFVDISSESFRTYVFPGGDEVTIQQPTYLSVSAGGHRLYDAAGTSHYIPKGWIQLKWKARDGQPNFVK